jgi:RNA polymerase sigma-70 factor (ECF subfamily)
MNRLTERDPVASIELGEIADDEAEATFDPADAARIHQELHRLGPKHREVLLLRVMEDLTYEQIAEVIGCTTGTVRSRLHYAKRALRERLEPTHE